MRISTQILKHIRSDQRSQTSAENLANKAGSTMLSVPRYTLYKCHSKILNKYPGFSVPGIWIPN